MAKLFLRCLSVIGNWSCGLVMTMVGGHMRDLGPVILLCSKISRISISNAGNGRDSLQKDCSRALLPIMRAFISDTHKIVNIFDRHLIDKDPEEGLDNIKPLKTPYHECKK